jgi:hypothetical protein
LKAVEREDNFFAEILHNQEPAKDTMIGVPATTHNLKMKLDGLRKIFDEDDTAQLKMK